MGEAASTSSITKITSLKLSLIGMSSPFTANDWSNTMSISSWFVSMRASGMETTLRPVCCAMALMRDVFPVPGGPCSSRPSLCGNPLILYLPVLSMKWVINLSRRRFSLKKRQAKDLSSLSLYRLYTREGALSPPSSLDDAAGVFTSM